MVDNDAAKRPDTIPIETIRQEHTHEFIENGKRIGENGLAVGSGGNLSMKVPGGILITSSGSILSDLKPDEIVFVPYADGDTVYFTGSKKPSSETINHWIIYQERPNVKAISHVNVGPKESKHITTAKEEIPYGTIELGYDTAALFKTVDVVILKNHGVMAVGNNLSEATDLLIDSTDKTKPYIFAPAQKSD